MNSGITSFDKIEQKINGSRKISNYIIGGMLTIGGVGFLLASLSSYTGRDLLPQEIRQVYCLYLKES